MFKKIIQKFISQPIKTSLIKKIKILIEEQLNKIWKKQIETYAIVLILILAAFLLDYFIQFKILGRPICMLIIYITSSLYFSYKGFKNLQLAYRIYKEKWFDFKKIKSIKDFISLYVINKYKVVNSIHKVTHQKKILGLDLNKIIPTVDELIDELYDQYKKQTLSFVLFSLLAAVFSKFLMQYLM